MNSVFVSAIRSAALALLLISFFSIRVGFAQEGKSATASVSFFLDFPQSIPDHYEISVASDGQASYDSTGKLTPDSEPGDPFHLEFTISPASTKRIFDLAARAKYFDGKIDSGKRNLASTGAKVMVVSSPWCSRGAPQEEQKFEAAGLRCPHWLQNTARR